MQMASPNRYRLLENATGAAIASTAFIVYILTACRTLNFIDSGELAAVASTLGIAHPTGYPLFTLLGWCFVHLPMGLRPIFQLNLMAALFCASAVFAFFKLSLIVLAELPQRSGKGNKRREEASTGINPMKILTPAAGGALILAFSETFWSQAVAIEVYSLHCLFLTILLFTFLRSVLALARTGGDGGGSKPRGLYLFAFLLGLAFTNHMTTILLAPAFLYFYFSVAGFRSTAWRRLFTLAPLFLLGLSAYLYLPVRGTNHPLMNWGNPVDAERFFRHLSGKQYTVWLFSSTETAIRQLSGFLSSLPGEYVYLPLLLALIGVISLFRSNRRMFTVTVLLFLGCVFYSINYDIHDIDSYFLLAQMMIALWSAVGISALMQRATTQLALQSIRAAVVIVCALECGMSYRKVDQSRMNLVEGYTRDLFASVDRNAIILSYQWDYFVSAAAYLQLVEGERPDIVVIDKELMRRSWYFVQLEKRYPWLMERSKSEWEAYRRELLRFERSEPYDPSVIEYRYTRMIGSFLERNQDRPVYVTPEIEQQYTAGWNRVPSGLAFRLERGDRGAIGSPPPFTLEKPAVPTSYTSGLIGMYARAYLNYAIDAERRGNRSAAEGYLSKSLEIEPDMREALVFREHLGVLP